ncbi:hypothetical protein [Brevibacillus reuszeri]|uniref:hypothetical protein n=1 Tax=Brevibacillus reuszeri TaxID=54915 RepID=UPI000CCC8F1E|nr:hypothetical protein [Brevibacillus reuszeri]
MYTLIGTDTTCDVIWLRNRLREECENAPIPLFVDDWFNQIEDREKGYLVQINERYGFLLVEEFAHTGDMDEDKVWSEINGRDEEVVYQFIELELYEHFRNMIPFEIYASKGYGFLNRHEFCVFFPIGTDPNIVNDITLHWDEHIKTLTTNKFGETKWPDVHSQEALNSVPIPVTTDAAKITHREESVATAMMHAMVLYQANHILIDDTEQFVSDVVMLARSYRGEVDDMFEWIQDSFQNMYRYKYPVTVDGLFGLIVDYHAGCKPNFFDIVKNQKILDDTLDEALARLKWVYEGISDSEVEKLRNEIVRVRANDLAVMTN